MTLWEKTEKNSLRGILFLICIVCFTCYVSYTPNGCDSPKSLQKWYSCNIQSQVFNLHLICILQPSSLQMKLHTKYCNMVVGMLRNLKMSKDKLNDEYFPEWAHLMYDSCNECISTFDSDIT